MLRVEDEHIRSYNQHVVWLTKFFHGLPIPYQWMPQNAFGIFLSDFKPLSFTEEIDYGEPVTVSQEMLMMVTRNQAGILPSPAIAQLIDHVMLKECFSDCQV